MIITTTCLPPPIAMKFNPNLLSHPIDYWGMKKFELEQIKKELSNITYGKKKTEIINQLIKEFEEKYERSMVAKEKYETKKKANAQESGV